MTDLATTLVLGGARSGKSAFAEQLVGDSGLARIYLATATAGDDEMRSRINHHRARRGEGWTTVEEPLALVDALTREATHGRAVLVDCLTLWLSNLMMAERDPEVEARRNDCSCAYAGAGRGALRQIGVCRAVGRRQRAGSDLPRHRNGG